MALPRISLDKFDPLQWKPIKINSIKFEIGILYTLILGVILIVFSLVFFVTFKTLYNEINYDLEVKAQEVDHTIRAYLDVLGVAPNALVLAAQKTVSLEIPNPLKVRSKEISKKWLKRSDELELRKDYINFASKEGVPLAKSKNLSEELQGLFLKDISLTKDSEKTYRKINYNKEIIQLINYPFVNKDGQIYVIQVGIVEGRFSQLMQKWIYSIAISIPIILLLTSFVGQFLAKKILDPVQEITHAAQNITHQDLSRRIDVKEYDEEMKDLVSAFNEMISRLEKSFRHIEEFSYHVAHELKTPLTIIRGESELALRKGRDIQEYQKTIRINAEESERMLKTVEDLLLLAKLDYQPQTVEFRRIQFNEFITEIFEQSRILAERKNIKISLKLTSTLLQLEGNPLQLRRLFFNIIDNAIKYTSVGGKIYITVEGQKDQIITVITDTGQGMSEEHLARIFERFYRIDNNEPGNGLGLNIVQSIIKIHRGDIRVSSQIGKGTAFTVILPAVV